MITRLLTPLICLLVIAHAAAAASDADPFYARYISLAIQGDLSAARALFDDEHWSDNENVQALKSQFEERFESGVERPSSTFLEEVVQAYRAYWRATLLPSESSRSPERGLEDRIDRLLATNNGGTGEGDRFVRLHQALNERGLHVLESASPPMRDLFLWRTQERRAYRVNLYDTEVDLDVVFIDGFALQGWKDFASLGLATTTGWVEDDVLYCLAWAYDTDSENFEVSYLRHEARHLVDLEQFPLMQSEDLEYRAKLTELVHANESLQRILNDFGDKAANNPDSPHAMANWRVIRDIYWSLHGKEMPDTFTGWHMVDGARVNRAARELLKAHTAQQSG